ncbi:unnamed protein product [Plutella xylostella]|uniref:(diamondback moth) hypothetical protein n=1 Tax=Plutella xylostella TaxID=51655 RepID=A0A8S4F7E6_PLUXY|nr:unnamed protein product [Plutella xylostella]
MRVKTAAQIFSHSVAVATEHLTARGDLPERLIVKRMTTNVSKRWTSSSKKIKILLISLMYPKKSKFPSEMSLSMKLTKENVI